MVSLALVGGNDDVIEFTFGSDFILESGLRGLGIPSTEVRISESAADGGAWRFSKRGVREVDMPIVIVGADRGAVEDNLRRLANLLRDTVAATTLRATYATGEVWELGDGHYTGGGETQWGDDGSQVFARWYLSLQFANPFWIREESESFSLGAGVGSGDFVTNLSEMSIVGSQAIGDITVENSGDVDAYPVWIFRGPAESVHVEAQSGASFTYAVPILLGESITVDTRAGTVVDSSGGNQYSNLGPSPRMFLLPAGNSQISVEATGADENTLVSMYYRPRKEIVH
jgi:hypothetical protein